MNLLPASDYAVLLLAHGGPESLDEVSDFLRHIRGGKPLTDAFINEVVERYKLIGGKSPLRGICENLAAKLSQALDKRVYVGMRHWNPFISSTIERIMSDGHKRMVVVCLAPHYSSLSIGAYRKSFLAALEASQSKVTFQFVEDWHQNQDLIEFHAGEILKVRQEVGNKDFEKYQILFTAHSLPSRVLDDDEDPYVVQLQQTMKGICESISLLDNQCELIFQSASPSGEPWLKPNLEDALERLSKSQTKNVLVVPIGFVAEHFEILYDLDIAAKEYAVRLGISLKRTQMPNDSQDMVAIMRGIVEESAFGFSQSVIIGARSVALHEA